MLPTVPVASVALPLSSMALLPLKYAVSPRGWPRVGHRPLARQRLAGREAAAVEGQSCRCRVQAAAKAPRLVIVGLLPPGSVVPPV